MSRMRVVDEQDPRGRIMLTHLSFEDFLEALCRCATCKAWPTRDEVEAAGESSTGDYLRSLKVDDPEAYTKLLSTRAVAFTPPSAQ